MRHRSAFNCGNPAHRHSRIRFALVLILASSAATLLLGGCGSSSGGSAPADTQSSPAASAPAAVDPTPSVAAAPALKSSSVTHDYTNASGFSSSVKVTVWKPEPKGATSPVAHPLDSTVTLDPSSDYDPTTDLVIPVAVTLTNTTKGFDIKQPRIVWWVQGLNCGSKSTTEVRTLDFRGWYSDGWETTTWDVGTQGVDGTLWQSAAEYQVQATSEDVGNPAIITWSDPLPPGESDTQVGFFIYHDHATPKDPNGTAWVLNYLLLGPEWNGGDSLGFFRHPPYLALSGKKVMKPEWGD